MFERTVRDIILRFGLPSLQVLVGGTFLWFGLLKVAQATPLRPFFQAGFPGIPTTPLMQWVGTSEAAIGLLILLPFIVLPEAIERWLGRLALVLMLGYLAAAFWALFAASANIFSPSIPYITAFGDFILHRIIAGILALVILAEVTNNQPLDSARDKQPTTSD